MIKQNQCVVISADLLTTYTVLVHMYIHIQLIVNYKILHTRLSAIQTSTEH